MDALMAEIEKERAVMEQSGGGVTLCGGEPLMYPEYTLQLLKELGRRGFHRTVDTTLYAMPDVVKSVADNCELLLVDLKMMDSDRHRRYTAVPNEQILDNIRLLADMGKDFFIRIPLIEGINADDENIGATACFLKSLPPLGEVGGGSLNCHLLPYHDVGKDKHRRMWSRYNPDDIPMCAPSDDTIERCKRLLEASGLRVIIGG